jgi:hypothetical protein
MAEELKAYIRTQTEALEKEIGELEEAIRVAEKAGIDVTEPKMVLADLKRRLSRYKEALK